jgi:glycosyltransferase involved in cell wall biosynthesis
MKRNILWLRERFPWMGSHSGYDILYQEIKEMINQNSDSILVARKDSFIYKILFKCLTRISKRINPSPRYNPYSMLGEIRLLFKLFSNPTGLVHIMYLEKDYGLFHRIKKRFEYKILATAHQPPTWWSTIHKFPELVCSLDGLIVVSTKQKTFFEKYLPGKVFFIRHGIDLNFFSPKPKQNKTNNYLTERLRCVFCGHWMRDFNTLSIVIEKILKSNPEIFFDLVVSPHGVDGKYLNRILPYKQVKWYIDISDEQLRNIYRHAALLFLPLLDCTANNALLESIATGLPVITTDVGGVRDYTDESFTEYYHIEDTEGMKNGILNLLKDSAECEKRGNSARYYAEKNLSWKKIALQTMKIYEKIC